MNPLKRHWLIASLVVVGIAVFAAFRFKGSEEMLKSVNHEGHKGSGRKAHSSAKQLDFPSCTFVPFVVKGLSSPHQITAVTSPNSIDHV